MVQCILWTSNFLFFVTYAYPNGQSKTEKTNVADLFLVFFRGKPMTLLYGEGDEDIERCPQHVKAVQIKCPSPFGSHHTSV